MVSEAAGKSTGWRGWNPGPGDAAWPWPDPMRALGLAWDLTRSAWLAPADLQRLAERRWRFLVEYACLHSPFYRELYGSNAEMMSARLQDLPIVTKKMLMRDFDRVVTDPSVTLAGVRAFLADPQRVGAPFAASHAVWASSGTSGEPGIFVHDRQALAIYDALQLLRFRGATAGVDGMPLPFGMERFALVAATGGHFAGAASVERLRRLVPWLAGSMRVFSLMQPLAELVAALNEFAPDVLATYPTVAAQLAAEQEAGRLRIAPKQIWTGGECLSAATRDRVARTFASVVREEYGASEFASIAVGCTAGWLHVNADWALLEPVDAAGRPVPPGRPSHTVLLTNLANRVQPLIRYDLGDSITLRTQPCPCGNRMPAIRVQGRRDDQLELAGHGGLRVVLLPLVLVTVLEEGADVYDFQLVQTGSRALHLRLAPQESPKAPAALHALREFLREQGLDEVAVELEAQVPRRASGGAKLRRILLGAQSDS